MAHFVPPRPAGSLRLLVAEDEPHIRRILVTLLEASGFQVDIARDGQEAVERLRGDTRYDMVLTDLLMPETTGLELLEIIRDLPGRRDVPVIVLTAKGQDADRDRAYALGAADFITKPFSPKKLLNRVDQILGQA
ncbi:MAG: response regulator [Gemmatimonadales bacterium]|nr:MAG: response regulator [Gemmatimonadales bacterium]